MRNVVNADAEAGPDPGPGAGPEAATSVLDLAFLDIQTFGDCALAREVLALFVGQARRIVASLPDLSAREQRDAAHLLKGSARGIGAWAAAAIADAYEQAEPAGRDAMQGDLAATFVAVEAAIERYVEATV